LDVAGTIGLDCVDADGLATLEGSEVMHRLKLLMAAIKLIPDPDL
jgi:hypothetical protein